MLISGYKIGFTATGGTILSNRIVNFPTIKSNFGSGFSPSTGKFTCSHSGYYYFAASLIKARGSHSDSDGIWCDLRKNSDVITSLYNDPTDDDSDKGAFETSGYAFVHLNHGDTVYIDCRYTGVRINIDTKSSFSGFMLVTD